MIEVKINCPPPKSTAQGSLRFANGRMYKAKGVESDWLSILFPYRPKEPLEGPLSFSVELIWPFLAKHSATKAARDMIDDPLCLLPCDQKPDFDNIAKALLDTMTKLGFWKDDKQIFEGTVRKFYGHAPSIAIRVTTWEGLL